jgi:hypothetical protein
MRRMCRSHLQSRPLRESCQSLPPITLPAMCSSANDERRYDVGGVPIEVLSPTDVDRRAAGVDRVPVN